MKRQNIGDKEEVLRQINEASDAIRRKYQIIKTEPADADRVYADILKPVVTPLKALVEKEKPIELKKDSEIKVEKNALKDEETDVLQEAREALRKKDLDTVWGVRESGGQLMLGDTAIQTHGNQLMVAGNSYILTPGLLELLLKKHPQMSQITPQDWDDYQAMVTSTNTNRKRYLKTGPIRSSTMEKISRFTKKGKGMLPYAMLVSRGHKMDYVYWDDPNELVDRLQLLAASYQAGNKSHTNEIMSILGELREADLIE